MMLCMNAPISFEMSAHKDICVCVFPCRYIIFGVYLMVKGVECVGVGVL